MGEPGDLVVELVWIRLANGVPISLENARLPADRFPGLLDMPLSGSVHEFLDVRFGVIPAESVERMSVVAASEEEATILEMEPQAPLLSISRVTKDSAGVPIEFSHDLFRADRTVLVVRSVGYGSGQNPVTLQGSTQLSAQAESVPGGARTGGWRQPSRSGAREKERLARTAPGLLLRGDALLCRPVKLGNIG